jgi:hypothetical protein
MTMRLTQRELNRILRNLRVSIPADVKRALLDTYGSSAVDDDGHIREYTEQDICEQLSKILRPYQERHRGGVTTI